MANFKLGSAGSHLANAVALLTTNWGVVLTLILAIVTGAWEWATNFVLSPAAQAGGKAFLFLLWTYVGLRWLAAQKQVRTVRVAHDYAYSIINEGFQIAYDEKNDENTLQIGVSFRNVGNGPMRLQAELVRVVLGDRTVPDVVMAQEMMLARLSVKGVRTGNFKKEVIKPTLEGFLDISLVYGPPDTDFVRRYKLRVKLYFRFDEGKFVGLNNDLLSETDEPIHPVN